MTFDMDAGIVSYVGATGAGVAEGAGREAASAAAIEVAIIVWLVDRWRLLELYQVTEKSRSLCQTGASSSLRSDIFWPR